MFREALELNTLQLMLLNVGKHCLLLFGDSVGGVVTEGCKLCNPLRFYKYVTESGSSHSDKLVSAQK